MPTDLTAIDLATLNAVQGVIVAALRNQCCQWEQQSCDAAAVGRLSSALMLEHWAFAAELLAGTISTEISTLFDQALDARLNWDTTTRSVGDQLLDALTVEIASAQSEALVPC
jgi:hypothetical protein